MLGSVLIVYMETTRVARNVKTPSAPRKVSRELFGSSKRVPRSVVEKRVVKFLSICSDPKTFRLVVREAPESVIKTVCNAAFNAERGDVRLSNAEKGLFRKYRKQISILTSTSRTLGAKRRLLSTPQSGGAVFLPALLTAVLGSLGSRLFKTSEH